MSNLCWLCNEVEVLKSVRLDIVCCTNCYQQQKDIIQEQQKDLTFEQPDYIIDNVFLGSQRSALDLQKLRENGIQSIIVAGDNLTAHFPSQIDYKILEIEDSPFQIIKPCFQDCIDFIREKKDSGNVLVHCASGISRSATIVLSYLIYVHGMSLSTAISFLLMKRPVIHPNSGFQRQLKEYAKELNLDDSLPEDAFEVRK